MPTALGVGGTSEGVVALVGKRTGVTMTVASAVFNAAGVFAGEVRAGVARIVGGTGAIVGALVGNAWIVTVGEGSGVGVAASLHATSRHAAQITRGKNFFIRLVYL